MLGQGVKRKHSHHSSSLRLEQLNLHLQIQPQLAAEYKRGPIFLWDHPDPPSKLSSQSQCEILIMDHTGHLSEMINCASGAGEGTSPASIYGAGGLEETPGCPFFSHCTGGCLLPVDHWCLNSSSVTAYPNEVMAV